MEINTIHILEFTLEKVPTDFDEIRQAKGGRGGKSNFRGDARGREWAKSKKEKGSRIDFLFYGFLYVFIILISVLLAI